MAGTVLHIGLHKAATRFLQRGVFKQLGADKALFNPPYVMEALRTAIATQRQDDREKLVEAAQRGRLEAGSRTLVISDPAISGNMYTNHRNYVENLELVAHAFPEARIVYFIRNHADWLHSAYRQSLVKGRGVPIEFFLNFYDGQFQRPLARKVFGARNCDALGLKFLEIYQQYCATFGDDRVYLLRQEDLRSSADLVSQRLADALGIESLPQPPKRVSSNRSFSTFAIGLFFPRTHLFRLAPQKRGIDSAPHPVVQKMGKPWRRLRTLLIRHMLDRIVYWDRDLLARNGMRERLELHYEPELETLRAVSRRILENGPPPDWNSPRAANVRRRAE